MGYYSEKLAGKRLKRCYDIAPPRVKQYLEAEIERLISKTGQGDSVLELGCGYGRVALRLAAAAGHTVGIDTAVESIEMARGLVPGGRSCEFIEMDATAMSFEEGRFDLVACVQNGICAFGVDMPKLVTEALRVTRPGGLAVFSSYSERFWEHRLEWFEIQAAEGLLGEIDYEKTGGGFIVCKDGFRAGAMGEEDFRALCAKLGLEASITEVDGSSIFCEIVKP